MTRLNQILLPFAFVLFISSCTNENVEDILEEANPPVDPNTATIWDGEMITFTKEDGADPNDEANQDRITDQVWITRDNDGGPIFNIRVESSNNNFGPTGTLWAIGSVEDIETLTFEPLRTALGGQRMSFQDAPNADMVLFLTEENIFIPIRFLSWSSGKQGGFSYERASPR